MSRVNAPGRLAIAVKTGLLAATMASAWPANASSAPEASAQQRLIQSYDIGAGSLVDVLTRHRGNVSQAAREQRGPEETGEGPVAVVAKARARGGGART